MNYFKGTMIGLIKKKDFTSVWIHDIDTICSTLAIFLCFQLLIALFCLQTLDFTDKKSVDSSSFAKKNIFPCLFLSSLFIWKTPVFANSIITLINLFIYN